MLSAFHPFFITGGQIMCCMGVTDLVYESCPESIQPFLISGEPVAWPCCNVAASQRRPYCASVNRHSPVGLVIQQ